MASTNPVLFWWLLHRATLYAFAAIGGGMGFIAGSLIAIRGTCGGF